ncbi:MAG: SMC-Scp complex subunit ScpB [Candidatus Komeilibacteria bacterium RIFOXYC1_FULL_37_11]|uniref:SMC-Scp complex subunit ScpB n=1 Tax=Candidatus Komeilibacteria bacterium RIFOXYC1_FULL_37_11 TaxID=1798555 RepID=A0A1G2BXL2_9BACT|nr:MAG: SMC-Scp complex subunit ScpB [Candidatus Komeilibacteria bacterium RIFOXYC1_FULL_37_11]OGY95638.1 MAG: SMC-Scp complex subunit ScpB [Candidatus Komeilibacteria bacterium RIFOXYD2_FULL_37_8]OGY95881.1 MAG: SMC-Scp complex subunit ScpB [Candidatus Komeilibacteria bacterium RIFOXYD1_FULL_37_29]
MAKNSLSILESLLLTAGKPLTYKELSNLLECGDDELAKALAELSTKYNQPESGIHILLNNQKAQFVSNPDNIGVLKKYFKDELSGELTKPSLETLTIIAYRQPVSKEELEQIRGVNCSIIIRNLLIRGLIEESTDTSSLTTNYSVTMDFLKYMGIDSVSELPDYEKLNNDENLSKLLDSNTREEK